jgi:hypothetical protein
MLPVGDFIGAVKTASEPPGLGQTSMSDKASDELFVMSSKCFGSIQTFSP